MNRRSFTQGLAVAAFALAAALPACADLPQVPYVPTAQPVVDRMLEMAKVTSKDVVYDLGCGDGRIVITAAKRYGARGVGIDINPERIAEANINLKDANLPPGKVKFLVGDLFKSDFSEATVVMLYLLPDVNVALRPQLWKQLPVGARVVSHDYHMGDEWPPEQTVHVANKVVYAWTIRPEHKKMVK
jgi:trans-aconitate methyltransferase